MVELEAVINTVLEQLKSTLTEETWESRQRYFNQMRKIAETLNIHEPCQELYDAYVADDNGSKERRSMHIRCVRLLDATASTNAKDKNGTFYNERVLPSETEALEYFMGRCYPLEDSIPIDMLIVKAEVEMRHLNLSESTNGQYRHSWMDIRRFLEQNGTADYSESLMQAFICETDQKHNDGAMNEWKWKINRKAAYVLIEVANTGRFHWDRVKRNVSCTSPELEPLREQYLASLKQRNLRESTIDLHDYVFRKTMGYADIKNRNALSTLSCETVQLVIIKFAGICNRRSMATILPILRLILKYLHAVGMIEKDISEIVMGCFAQRGSVAAYISDEDQAMLTAQLDRESKRTKAIILIAMKLGLRDCDICDLTFRQIDWREDKIRLSQHKTGEPLVLPLLPDVGNALMDYILNERPKGAECYPYIFLRKQAPYKKLTTVYSTCSKLLRKHNIKPVNGTATGTHLFRYTMVHRLLAAKVPHQVITDILGHASKESDKPYLSMEESMLRMCALDLSVIGKVSWGGGAINA